MKQDNKKACLNKHQKKTGFVYEHITEKLPLNASAVILESLFAIDEGFCIIEVLFDETDHPYDYRFIETNNAFEEQTGTTDAVGKTASQIAPELEQHWFELFGRVAKTGKPERFENSVKASGRHYSVYAFRIAKSSENYVAVLFNDITERKLAQNARFFLASIVDSSQDSIVIVDFDNVITSWNKGAEKLYGYPANETIGKSLKMVILPEDIKQVLSNVDRIRYSNTVERFETVRIKKDGQLIDLEIELSPVKNDSGSVIGVSTVARNITGRKRQEANLALLAALDREFAPLQSVQQVIALAGEKVTRYLNLNRLHFSVIDVENDVIEIVYEYPEAPGDSGLTGRQCLSAFIAEEIREKLRAGKYILAKEDTADQLLYVPHLEGSDWNFMLTLGRSDIASWRDDEIALLYELASKIYLRIERARAEEALQKSEAKFRRLSDSGIAEERYRSKMQLEVAQQTMEIVNLNTELKRLNAITAHNYTDTLRQAYINLETIINNDARNLSNTSKANLRRAQSAIQKMKLLSNDINRYLRLYDMEISKKWIDPNKIIEDVIKSLQQKIEETSTRLEVAVLPEIYADPELATILFTHLVDNGIKFQKPGTDSIISISEGREIIDQKITHEINSDCCSIIIICHNGIDMEDTDKLFIPFAQTEESGNQKTTGISLAICKKIMTLHKGYIIADRAAGIDSSFSCYFPAPNEQELPPNQ